MDENNNYINILKIGELLRKEGFIGKEDIQRALQVQKEENEIAGLPVEQYMLKKNLLTKIQLEKLKEHPEYGIIDTDNLAYRLNIISKKNLDDIKNRREDQRSVGEILCDTGIININDLQYILHKYRKQLRFGEILLKRGHIDEAGLHEALREQSHRADPLGKILVEKNIITTDQLYQVLSKQHNIPYRKLVGFVVYDNMIEKLTNIIGYRYAGRHLVVPLEIDGNELTIAVFSPDRLPIIHELGSVYAHLKITGVFISEDKFNEIFKSLYGVELAFKNNSYK